MPVPTRRRVPTLLSELMEGDGFENRIRRLFGELAEEPWGFGWTPPVDVAEKDDELILTAELPGMKKEDLEIEVEGNVLTIQGRKREEREQEKEKGELRYRLSERTYGDFSRSFTLPAGVVSEKLTAEFADGVLTVHMPKKEEAKGRKIQIKGA